jgi:hypothetical protein
MITITIIITTIPPHSSINNNTVAEIDQSSAFKYSILKSVPIEN